MKKLVYILTLLFSTTLFSQGIKFEEASFKDILAKAKKENKIVFLDAYASWCGPCKMMEKNVFTDQSVSDYYNSHFINAHFDMEKGEGRQIAAKYQIMSYPTLLYLNGDGEVVHKGMGYTAAQDFLAMGKEADNPFNRKGSLKAQFENGESDPEFLKNAVKLYANTDPEFSKKVSERYFSNKKDKAFTREEISMLLYFLKSADDANYKVFRESKAEITKLLPENIYNQFDTQMKLSKVIQKSVDPAKQIIDEVYFNTEAVKLVGKEEADLALNRLKLSFYPSVGNFKAYEKAALDYYKDGEGFNAQELGTAAAIFSEKIDNVDALKKALVWAEKSVMNSESLQNIYVLATLYNKTGNTASAKMYAEKAMTMAQEQNLDPRPIQELLNALK